MMKIFKLSFFLSFSFYLFFSFLFFYHFKALLILSIVYFPLEKAIFVHGGLENNNCF